MVTGSKPKQFIDNLNNVSPEANRHFMNKNREYLKAKIGELETNSKTKNIRNFYMVIIDSKKVYHLRTTYIHISFRRSIILSYNSQT